VFATEKLATGLEVAYQRGSIDALKASNSERASP
jgi:hypothetical protein